MDIQAAIKYFCDHEGLVTHMYLDTEGLVTVGVGLMLPSPDAAATYKFVVRTTGLPATKEEIWDEWDRVHGQKPGQISKYYLPFTTLEFTQQAARDELAADIAGFTTVIERRFPQFASYPDTAQLAILDMVYSMGLGGVEKEFPKFCAAVDRKDWPECAVECHRSNQPEARNAACAQLFSLI